MKPALIASVFKDSPATAEMLGLVRRVFRVAEVDQVEVDVFDLSPAEVGAAEVGLADRLGGLDVLIVVIVGIETGTASLAGDRTPHQSATGRAEVEARSTQVGAKKLSAGPVDLGQPGFA